LIFIVLGGTFFDFSGPRDAQLAQQGIDTKILVEDRISIMRKSAFKTLIFCGLTFGLLWLSVAGRLKSNYLIAGLALFIIADQWTFVRQHVGADDFISERNYEQAFAPSSADQRILQDDDPHFRVYNTTAGLTSDSYTSYYHKSIGGYHGAKLIRYQDLIENQMSKGNMEVFNMLNAKWFITKGQNGQEQAQLNQQALGSAWLVDDFKVVPNADAEMAALSDFDPASTAIVDERFKEYLPENPTEQNANIQLTSYDPKELIYEASVPSGTAFAVFSEIYYEGGEEDWKAYIDGEHVDHIRVNYLLRGLKIPEGQHTIEFRFEPRAYYTGESIALVFSILLVLSVAAVAFMKMRKKAKAA